MFRVLTGVFLLCFLGGGSPLYAQGSGAPSEDLYGEVDPDNIHPTDVIHWQQLSGVLYQNSYLKVLVSLSTSQGFALYRDQLHFLAPYGLSLYDVKNPPTIEVRDPITAKMVEVWAEGTFEVVFKVERKEVLKQPLSLGISSLGCSVNICLFPYTHTLILDFLENPSEAYVPPTRSALRPLAEEEPSALSEPEDSSVSEAIGLSWEHMLARQLQQQNLPFYLILLICFLGGLLTNLTPCVYPMIPITLRVLSLQSRTPYFGSFMYGSGIFIIYTLLGVVAALSGAVLGSFASSMTFQVMFGMVMVWMALSMLGYSHFAFLSRVGGRLRLKQESPANAFVMGTGAGFVASACTGPVLVGLATYALSHLSVVGAAVLFGSYSLGFAAPYLFLGPMIPKITKLKVPGGVHVGVKVAMAATLMSLAFYFWRIPLHSLLSSISEGLWLVLMVSFLILGTVGVAVVILRYSWHHRKGVLLIPTIALSLGLFATAQVLQKSSVQPLPWVQDIIGIEEILQQKERPVLIAMWAEWCGACKVMEATTFQDPEVRRAFKDYDFHFVKYDVTAMNEYDREILKQHRISGLPAYVLLPKKPASPASVVLYGVYPKEIFIMALEDKLSDPPPIAIPFKF